ncbi:hypothetical protein [Jeongeupia sp. USM3]|uniref:hypothetical protein n=1 Tax=Jeongeupia sp. USM3 TaxID=1906741 RepID=UPI00089DE281|nr:hypothetical protein [Jeongeupia sp. USM3]AOY00588.1 hypothetical protein BJP62_09140 [Jeongeupia sp. USM3]
MKRVATRVHLTTLCILALTTHCAWADVPPEAVEAGEVPIAQAMPGVLNESALPASAPDGDRIILAEAGRIDHAGLTEIRAGADLGGALSVSFAIERKVSIDGQILAATAFKWSNQPAANGVSASVASSLGAAAQAGALVSGAVGGGGTQVTLISIPNNVLPVQVIQNNVDNRVIQASTVLNVSSSSFSQALNNRVLDSLRNSVVQGIR